jgi:hypothetical protein
MKGLKFGMRIIAKNSYSDEYEFGTIIDFDKVNNEIILIIYFEEFGQVLECTPDEVIVMKCEECFEYSRMLYKRGEIGIMDAKTVAINRHILKGCDTVLNSQKVIVGLEKLYEFLYGAHLATTESESSATFHMACHKITEIIQEIKLNGK